MTSRRSAVLLVVVVCSIDTLAQSDYDNNASFGFAEQAQGLPALAPNGCRAKGFSATTVNNGQKICRNRLVFLDHLNELDTSKWQQTVQISDEPDFEFTVYDKDPVNLFFERGLLHIRASLLEDKYGHDFVMTGSLGLQGCTSGDSNKCSHRAESFDIVPPVQSARITTQNALSFRYGTVDLRARMPSGDWLYPIIALRPATSAYGPNYASGEIRFPYAVGNRNHHNELTAGIVLQPPESSGEPTFLSVNYTNTNSTVNYQRQFHVYRLNWSPGQCHVVGDRFACSRSTSLSGVECNRMSLSTDGFEFFVDGNSIGKLTPPEGGWAAAFENANTGAWLSGTRMAPFDQEFYLSIGLAAGGVSRFPDGSAYPHKPWMNTSPKAILNFWKSRDKWQQSWDNPRLELAFVRIRALD